MLKLRLQTLVTGCEELTHWKRTCCWERLKAGGDGDNRGWDSWMASPTQWTWVWASTGSSWWTRKPGVLQSMGWLRVGHDWETELNWTFIFIKRLVSSSLLSTIKVLSSAYLRLMMFLLAIYIPPCESSSPAFCMMYSTNKLNKQGDNIQPWRTPFPSFSQFVVPCPVLTAYRSCPAYRSQEAGNVVWYSYLFKNVPQLVVIHTVKTLT